MAARPITATNEADIAAIRAEFIALTNIARQNDDSSDDDSGNATPDTTLLQSSSHVINEMLMFESARSIAAARGIRVKTKEELSAFMRNGMLARAVDSSARSRTSVDAKSACPAAEPVPERPAPPVRVRAPKPPAVTARDRANAQFPSKRGKNTHIRKCLAAGFSLAEPPIDNEGNIAEIIKIRCVYGHIHACRSDFVLEHGLSSCHTCKCTDKIVNSVRYLLESTIGEPFTYEGDTYLHGIGVDMYIYLVKPATGSTGSGKPTTPAPDKCRVFRHGNELHVNVSYTTSAPAQLIAKLRTVDHTLPGDRQLSDLFSVDKRTTSSAAAHGTRSTGSGTRPTPAPATPTHATAPARDAPAYNGSPDMYFCNPTSSADVFNVRLTPSISNIFD